MEDKKNLSFEINAINLIKFSLPTTFTFLFLCSYQMIDGILVSKYLGTDALSSLNIVYPIVSLLIAIAIMLATGGNALVAKELGAGNADKARSHFTTIYIFSVIVGIVATVILMFLRHPILRALGTTDKLYNDAYIYMTFLLLVTTLGILQVLAQYSLIAAGKPIIAFVLIMLAGGSNIFFDYYFMSVMKLGIAGSGYATGISFAIPGVFGLFYFFFKKTGTLYFVKPKIELYPIIRAFFNGMSEMISYMSVAITTFLFNLSMLKTLGEDGVAAISIGLYIRSIFSAAYLGYVWGIAPVISYNYGKGDTANIKKIFRLALIFISCVSITLFASMYIFASPLIQVFVPKGSNIYNLAMQGMVVLSFGILLSGLNSFAMGMFTAFNNGVISALLAITRKLVFLVVFILVLPRFFGVMGVWSALPLSELLAFILSIYVVFKFRKKYQYM